MRGTAERRMMRRRARHVLSEPEEPIRRIVVVDDDIVVGMTLSIGLSGAEIIEAGRPTEGLARVQESRPDAVIVDRFFPGADGLELVRTLRADPATSKLPIVVLSAAYDDDREEVEAAGADAYLGKPFDPEALFAVVIDLVHRAPHVDRDPAPEPAAPPTKAPAKAPARRREPLRAPSVKPAALPTPPPVAKPALADVGLQLAEALASNERLVRHVEALEAEVEELRAQQLQGDAASQHLSVAAEQLHHDVATAEQTIAQLREHLGAALRDAEEVEQLRRELSQAHADIERLEQQADAPPPKKAVARKAKPTKR